VCPVEQDELITGGLIDNGYLCEADATDPRKVGEAMANFMRAAFSS
jgi:hypothetical protein